MESYMKLKKDHWMRWTWDQANRQTEGKPSETDDHKNSG